MFRALGWLAIPAEQIRGHLGPSFWEPMDNRVEIARSLSSVWSGGPRGVPGAFLVIFLICSDLLRRPR